MYLKVNSLLTSRTIRISILQLTFLVEKPLFSRPSRLLSLQSQPSSPLPEEATISQCCVSSVQFSHSVVSNSLPPHESQHARPPCPSPTLGVH